MDDDTGNPAVADRRKELLVTAFELVTKHPDAGQVWYAALQPDELQMLSSSVGDVLTACAYVIAALRGAVIETTPRQREALDTLKPLLNIPMNIKET